MRSPNRFVRWSTTSAGPVDALSACAGTDGSLGLEARGLGRLGHLRHLSDRRRLGDPAAAGGTRDDRVRRENRDGDGQPGGRAAQRHEHARDERERGHGDQPALPARRPPAEADAATAEPLLLGPLLHLQPVLHLGGSPRGGPPLTTIAARLDRGRSRRRRTDEVWLSDGSSEIRSVPPREQRSIGWRARSSHSCRCLSDGYVADPDDGFDEVFDWYFAGDVEVATASDELRHDVPGLGAQRRPPETPAGRGRGDAHRPAHVRARRRLGWTAPVGRSRVRRRPRRARRVAAARLDRPLRPGRRREPPLPGRSRRPGRRRWVSTARRRSSSA